MPPPDMPRTRLTDLAARSGVSTATVSRVLNRKPGVSESSRQAVYKAMDMLGYEPLQSRTPTSAGLVGLIVPELTNPIFPAFAQSIETVLARHGFTPLLCTQTASGASEEEYVETLVAAAVSGIVFVNGMHADTRAPLDRYRRLAERGVPYVLVNGQRSELGAPSVSADEAAGIGKAVQHLVSLGHSRIALMIGQERLVPSIQKREGFVAAVARHLGPDAEPRVVSSLYTVEGGEAAASVLLREGVSAIVCGSDLMALGAVRAATNAGLSVPADVSIIGFDDSALLDFTKPPLTTLRQPVASMSQAVVHLLLQAMQGQAESPELRFTPELIVRGSTAPPPPG